MDEKAKGFSLHGYEADLIRSSLSFLRLAKGNLSSEQIPSCL